MKIKYLLLAVAAVFAIACSHKEKHSLKWKEMDDFHMLMAESYHPFKDSANLAPAKETADELAASADKWAASTAPSEVDDAEVKTKLDKLSIESHKFAVQVKAAVPDSVLGASLSSLHESFHHVIEHIHGGHGEQK